VLEEAVVRGQLLSLGLDSLEFGILLCAFFGMLQP
jgi:hypothetical protein